MAYKGTNVTRDIKFHENQQFVLKDAADLQNLINNHRLADFARGVFGNYYGLLTGGFGFQMNASEIENGNAIVLPSKDFIFRPRSDKWNEVSASSSLYEDFDGVFNIGWQNGDALITFAADDYYTALEQKVTAGLSAYQIANPGATKAEFFAAIAANETAGFTTYLVGQVVPTDGVVESRNIYDDIAQSATATNVETRKEYLVQLRLEVRDGLLDRQTDSAWSLGDFLIGYSRSYGTVTISGVERTRVTNMPIMDPGKNIMEKIRVDYSASSNDQQNSILAALRNLADYIAKMNNDGTDDPSDLASFERNRSVIQYAQPVNSLAGLRKRIDSFLQTSEIVETEEAALNDIDTPAVANESTTGKVIARATVHFNEWSLQNRSVTTTYDASRAPYPPLILQNETDGEGNPVLAKYHGITYPVNADSVSSENYSFGFGTPLDYTDSFGDDYTYRFNYIFTPALNPFGTLYLMLRPGFENDYAIHSVKIKCIAETTSYNSKFTHEKNLEKLFLVQQGTTQNNKFIHAILPSTFATVLSTEYLTNTFGDTYASTDYKGIYGRSDSLSRYTLDIGNDNRYSDPVYENPEKAQEIFDEGFRYAVRINTPLISPNLMEDDMERIFEFDTTRFDTNYSAYKDSDGNVTFPGHDSGLGDTGIQRGFAQFPFTLIVEVYGTNKNT